MRYLIDPEYRVVRSMSASCGEGAPSARLRRELSDRNAVWALNHNHAHEVSLGAVSSVLYREDEFGVHGNFLDASYQAIKASPFWRRRLEKVHTTARRVLLSRDCDRSELDSSNSSDALLMNIFCHPRTLELPSVLALLAIGGSAKATFGYRPRIAFSNGKRDATEMDLKLDNLLIEAKLTEVNFQIAPLRLAERYRDFERVFDIDLLDVEHGSVRSYQLIRGILAAAATENDRFCVLCDARRSDLIEEWYRVMMAVKVFDLRLRLQLLTWQELAMCLPLEVREFLYDKFGICSSGAGSGNM